MVPWIKGLVLLPIFAIATAGATATITPALTPSSTNNNKRTELQDFHFRLKKNAVKPLHYDIKISLAADFEETLSFKGSVAITIELKESLEYSEESIFLNSLHLEISSHSLTGPTGTDFEINKKIYRKEYETAEFQFKGILEKSLKYTLTIGYDGKLQTNATSFYRSKYKNDENANEYLAATLLQPILARKLMPCFDEPEYKATHKLTLEYPKTYTVLFNTKPEPRIDIDDTIVKEEFLATPPMSTYLIAIVVSKFKRVTIPKKDSELGIEHAAWSRHVETSPWTKYGLQQSEILLTELERITSKSYSEININKIDHVVLPEISINAMGSWGLVAYKESSFLYDDFLSSTKSKQLITGTIVHELAQFWFGNLKTMHWWNDIWLNKGLARYFEYMAANKVNQEWELDKQFVVEQQLAIMNLDSLPTTKPLNCKVTTPKEISDKFNSITSSKSASLIRMVSHWMSKSEFEKVIKNYVSSDKTTVISEDFWKIVESEITSLPKDYTVVDIMKSYLNQAGFPLIKVSLLQDKVIITQERGFSFTEEEHTPELYYIPITYTTGSKLDFDDTTPKCWLRSTTNSLCSIPITDANSPFIVNLKATAYARVNYDEKLWRRILVALKTQHKEIDAINRAQIVDDALNLARAGKLHYSQALEIVSYLENEESYYPWFSAFNGFEYLIKRLNGSPELEQLMAFIKKLMDAVNKNNEDNTHIGILKVALTTSWMCSLQDEDFIQRMKKLFDEDITKAETELDSDTRETVYCTALRNDDKKEKWQNLFERFKKTSFASEAQSILTALGCTKNKELLKEYLMITVKEDSELTHQDAVHVFLSVIAGNYAGVGVGTDFFFDNYEDIEKRYGGEVAIVKILANLIDRFTNSDEIEKFYGFLKDKSLSYKTEVMALLKIAEANIAWTKQHKPAIKKYLHQYFNPVKPPPPWTPSPPKAPETTSQSIVPPSPDSAGSNIASILLVLFDIILVLMFMY